MIYQSLEELNKVAAWIIKQAGNERIFAFYGEMGAGKTTLIKEICHQLGAEDVVVSPTFALLNVYNSITHGEIYHFDFYRFENAEEAFDLGFEDYIYGNQYCFMEWPEKIEAYLPENTLKVKISILGNLSRKITFSRD